MVERLMVLLTATSISGAVTTRATVEYLARGPALESGTMGGRAERDRQDLQDRARLSIQRNWEALRELADL